MLKRLLKLLGLVNKQEKEPVEKVQKRVKLKGKVVAKELIGHDAEYMYHSVSEDPGVCPVCHTALEKIPNLDYRMHKKKGDVFYTYDGFCIVTEKFKSFCDANDYRNLKFTVLPKSPGYYVFEAEDVFRCDPVRSRFSYGKKQECCGQYSWITMGTMLCKSKEFYLPTDDFISSRDYWLGDGNRKSTEIIIGTKTAGKMKQAGISGIYFDDVIE